MKRELNASSGHTHMYSMATRDVTLFVTQLTYELGLITDTVFPDFTEETSSVIINLTLFSVSKWTAEWKKNHHFVAADS